MSGMKKSLLILFSVIVVIIITLAFLFKFNVIKFKEEKKEEEPIKVEEKLKYYFYDNTLTSYTTNDNSLEPVITYECKTEECYSLVNSKYYIVYDEGKLNFWSFKKEDLYSKLYSTLLEGYDFNFDNKNYKVLKYKIINKGEETGVFIINNGNIIIGNKNSETKIGLISLLAIKNNEAFILKDNYINVVDVKSSKLLRSYKNGNVFYVHKDNKEYNVTRMEDTTKTPIESYRCSSELCDVKIVNDNLIIYDNNKIKIKDINKKEDISSKLSYEVKTFIVDNETIKLYLFSNNSIYIIKDNEIINDETFVLKDCDISDTLLLYKKTTEGYKLYFVDLLNESVKYSGIMNEIVNSSVFSYEENYLYLEQSINSIYKRIYIFDKNYKYLGTSDKYYNKRINENNNLEFIDLYNRNYYVYDNEGKLLKETKDLKVLTKFNKYLVVSKENKIYLYDINKELLEDTGIEDIKAEVDIKNGINSYSSTISVKEYSKIFNEYTCEENSKHFYEFTYDEYNDKVNIQNRCYSTDL